MSLGTFAKYDTPIRIVIERKTLRPGMLEEESHRLDTILRNIRHAKYSHRDAVNALKNMAKDVLQDTNRPGFVAPDFAVADTLMFNIHQWIGQASDLCYYPSHDEFISVKLLLNNLRLEHRSYMMYYNKFRLLENPAGTYMSTGEAIDAAQFSRERLLESINLQIAITSI